jgi:hypothetical protein
MDDPTTSYIAGKIASHEAHHGTVDRDHLFLITTLDGPTLLSYEKALLVLELEPTVLPHHSYVVEIQPQYDRFFKVELIGEQLVRTAVAKDRT